MILVRIMLGGNSDSAGAQSAKGMSLTIRIEIWACAPLVDQAAFLLVIDCGQSILNGRCLVEKRCWRCAGRRMLLRPSE
jgi:hypothetical protein